MSGTGYSVDYINYSLTELIAIFQNQTSTGNTGTGFVDKNGKDLADIFAPYNGGALAPETYFVSDNYSSDLNGVFTYFPFDIQLSSEGAPTLSTTVYQGVKYNILTFLNNCSFSTTAPVNIEQIFLVGGGNSGEVCEIGPVGGNGGNGGGITIVSNQVYSSGNSFTINVGNGGVVTSDIPPGSYATGGDTTIIINSGLPIKATGGGGAAGGVHNANKQGTKGKHGTINNYNNLYYGGGGGGGGDSSNSSNGYDGGSGGLGGGGGGGGGGGASSSNGGNGGTGGGVSNSLTGGTGGQGAQSSAGSGNHGDDGISSQFGGGGGGGGQQNIGNGGYGGYGGGGGVGGGSGGNGGIYTPGISDPNIAGGGGGGGGGGGYGGGGGGGGFTHRQGSTSFTIEAPGNGGDGVVILFYNGNI